MQPAGSPLAGKPWLVLRGRELEAVLWNGPTLDLGSGATARLGPDIMVDAPDLDAMLALLRATDQAREIGDALLDQQLVAGIGNIWRAEGLFRAGVSPWGRLARLPDDELRRVLAETARAMRERHARRFVYRRAGRPCRRCGARIESRTQGDDARVAYWCPSCQAGTAAASA